ncbi:hypothetical protein NPIL_342141, partial [Nephila pilipes]
ALSSFVARTVDTNCVRRNSGFKNSDLEICPSVMDLTMDDEAQQAIIEEDNSLKCDELPKLLKASEETFRLHMHLLCKTDRLRK